MSGIEVPPFEKDHQVREAIRGLLQVSTPAKERTLIVLRLLASPELAVPHLPLIFGNLHNKKPALQDLAFDLARQFSERGYDLSCIAADLASHLSSSAPAHRRTAAELLEQLGPGAKNAEDFALGCLRNRDKEIVLAGLRILRSIGTALSRGISQRVSAVFELYPDDPAIGDLARAILDIIGAQSGGLSALTPADRGRLNGKRCLLVDDSAPYRQTIRNALEAFGAMVTEASTGEEALRKLLHPPATAAAFDLVLLDIRLPDINGLRVLQQLRQEAATKELPVVALSGLNNEGIINAARQLGVRDFIIKSTEMGITLKLIANAFEAPHTHA